jgi:hypothetical protein
MKKIIVRFAETSSSNFNANKVFKTVFPTGKNRFAKDADSNWAYGPDTKKGRSKEDKLQLAEDIILGLQKFGFKRIRRGPQEIKLYHTEGHRAEIMPGPPQLELSIEHSDRAGSKGNGLAPDKARNSRF